MAFGLPGDPPPTRATRGGDVFETRLLGRRTVVVRGRDGARFFYDQAVVERAGAVPHALADLLFGRGAVHGLDGEAHAVRKPMFLEVLTPAWVDRLATEIKNELRLPRRCACR